MVHKGHTCVSKALISSAPKSFIAFCHHQSLTLEFFCGISYLASNLDTDLYEFDNNPSTY
jgi:hypothetical protein